MNKIACCSTLNDAYLPGFITFFYTFIEHNSWFDLPYYIFEWGELSDESKEKLVKMYPNFIFKEIINEDYDSVSYDTKWRTWDINCCNRFDVFTLTHLDRLIFFDADMIVQGDLRYLFDIDIEFGAVETTPGVEMDHPGRYDKTIKTFDGGLMIISKKYLNLMTKKHLIDIAQQKNWSSDEPILNVYFDNTRTTFLPREYNLLTQELNNENLQAAKIVQFIGKKKPWYSGTLFDKFDDNVIKAVNNISTLVRLNAAYQANYNKAINKYEL